MSEFIPAIEVRRNDYIFRRGWWEQVIDKRPLSSSKNSPDMCSWQVRTPVGTVYQLYTPTDEMIEVSRD